MKLTQKSYELILDILDIELSNLQGKKRKALQVAIEELETIGAY
jgi:hypothetical protein